MKAAQLGIIGEPHLRCLFDGFGCDMETFEYKRVVAEGSLPWVLEAAFGYCPDDEGDDEGRLLVTGVNWSPGISNPFKRTSWYGGDGLDAILARQHAGPDEPVIVFLHLAHPRVEYTDRGKSAISFATIDPQRITDLVEAVTAKWAKQRKAEERHASARLRRDAALAGRRGGTGDGQAGRLRGDGGGVPEGERQRHPAGEGPAGHVRRPRRDPGADRQAAGRQLLHADVAAGLHGGAPRPHRRLEDRLRRARAPDRAAHRPQPPARHHRGEAIPARLLRDRAGLEPSASMPAIGTRGPSGRYGAVLFVEKEGFNELFEAVRLAERYDLAIMSTKGMSVTAARRLVDEICARYSHPAVRPARLRQSGFTILRTLQRDTRRYAFANEIEVIDLGLRLADVRGVGPRDARRFTTARSVESVRDGLRKRRRDRGGDQVPAASHRVELNAFTSDDLIEWITAKLERTRCREGDPRRSGARRGVSAPAPVGVISTSTSMSWWSAPASTSRSSTSRSTCVEQVARLLQRTAGTVVERRRR